MATDDKSKADVTVRRNDELHRYEASVDGELAGFAEYRPAHGRLVFTHTEVDDAFEGRGVGGQLAAQALDDVRAQNLHVTAVCPFIKTYIERHPAYADLVQAGS
jgi:predicted GNAT family acetyltransferase